MIKVDFKKAITGYLSAATLALVSLIGFNLLAPTTFWFHYDTVVLVPPAQAGKPLTFQSFREIKRPVRLGGVDVLYCASYGSNQFVVYSSRDWKSGVAEPSSNDEPKPWKYDGQPNEQQVCFLKSTVNAYLDFGIVRSQPPLYSERFIVW